MSTACPITVLTGRRSWLELCWCHISLGFLLWHANEEVREGAFFLDRVLFEGRKSQGC